MTTPDHAALTEAEREALHSLHNVPINRNQRACPICPDYIAAVEAILAARLAAVEAVRDRYVVLAGLPVHASDVADRLDAALGGGE